jgi:ribonuclease HI
MGAWAAFVVTPTGRRKLLYGLAYPTTISRCELIPIIEGLRWIAGHVNKIPGLSIRVYSDSEYTVKTLNGLYDKNYNQDLWAGAEATNKQFIDARIDYVYRERNSHPYMSLCDAICTTIRAGGKTIAEALFPEHVKDPELTIPEAPLPQEGPTPEGFDDA